MILQDFIHWLFKENPRLKDVYSNDITTISNVIGGAEIALTFLILGVVFILLTPKTTDNRTARKERITIGKLIGWALFFCGISRAVEVYAIWYNYGNLQAVLKNITGVIGTIVVAYIPFILKRIKNQATIDEVKQAMEKTHKKVEELRDLTEKIDNL